MGVSGSCSKYAYFNVSAIQKLSIRSMYTRLVFDTSLSDAKPFSTRSQDSKLWKAFQPHSRYIGSPVYWAMYHQPSSASGRKMYSFVSVARKSMAICFTRSGPIPVGCRSYICQQVYAMELAKFMRCSFVALPFAVKAPSAIHPGTKHTKCSISCTCSTLSPPLHLAWPMKVRPSDPLRTKCASMPPTASSYIFHSLSSACPSCNHNFTKYS
mmetsp:Transcript_89089/g.256823  ORF Transcript_89089/g.256823 Transcript_89089/m.256823 type:complete len:212 (-) Transcript_89089:107-742(-)